MNREVSPDLLAAAKRANNITWEDEDTDADLTSILLQGMAWLDSRIGSDTDYESEGTPKSLLMDYTRYARAGARNEFEDNYLSDLLALGMQAEIGRMTAGEDDEESGTDTDL